MAPPKAERSRRAFGALLVPGGQQLRDPQEVARGGDEVRRELRASPPFESRVPEAGNRLRPRETRAAWSPDRRGRGANSSRRGPRQPQSPARASARALPHGQAIASAPPGSRRPGGSPGTPAGRVLRSAGRGCRRGGRANPHAIRAVRLAPSWHGRTGRCPRSLLAELPPRQAAKGRTPRMRPRKPAPRPVHRMRSFCACGRRMHEPARRGRLKCAPFSPASG